MSGVRPEGITGARRAPFPAPFEPMLPTLTESVFQRDDWLYEPKFDGYRVVAFLNGGEVRLRSRGGLAYELRFPEIARDVSMQPAEQAVLDGEIVALGPDGRISFQRLQSSPIHPESVIRFYVFDLLYVDGFDLRDAPLRARKDALHALIHTRDNLEEVTVFDDGLTLFKAAQDNGLEGIVAKKRDSVYETGRRVRTWLKIKTSRADEFVVAGYTLGTGWRSQSLGSLILGTHDSAGKLRYAGHVGTGFNTESLAEMLRRLKPLERSTSPFDELIPRGGGSSRTGGKAIWVDPRVVVEVKFAERTEDGKLRHPVFLRVRDDKQAVAVRPEAIVVAPAANDQVALALAAIDNTSDRATVNLDGHDIKLTNLNKVLWPAWEDRRALAKRDLVRYFLQVAGCVLPHLKDRPVTMTRFPDGIHAGKFYQKSPREYAPPFVKQFTAYSDQSGRDDDYFVCNNVATLVWLAQMADLELHVTHTRISNEPDAPRLTTEFSMSLERVLRSTSNYPDFLVIDLDPYIYSGHERPGDEPELNPEGFARACEVAQWFREMLESIGIHPFLKTTGRTGLHLYVSIARTLEYDSVRVVAETLSRQVVAAHPNAVTMEWAVAARRGKVFLDYNMNRRSASLAAIYSPRAVDWAGVSTPLRWDELEQEHAYPTQFTILNVPERIAQLGDIWGDILESRVDLAQMFG